MKEENLSFIIINPFLFKSDYDFELPDWIVKRLNIGSEKDISIYSIVSVPEDVNKMTANLLAPIIINIKNMKAKQVILEDNRYCTKHFILDELKK